MFAYGSDNRHHVRFADRVIAMTRTRMCLATLAAAAGLALALPATATAATPADVKVSVESGGDDFGFKLSLCPVTATNVGGTTAYNVRVSGFSMEGTQFTIPELAPGESETQFVGCGLGIPVFGMAVPSDWNILNNFAASWRILPNLS